ncbi:hypothetical protein ACFPLB_04100 [Aquamicrobium segne]|uniref:Uncharacterized protein n=1 Tax=Aquamicrobium segne TaxID=469547 RepID=A0ABW0GU17_9HYPH
MTTCPELITLELSRLVRTSSAWERRFHEYELLLTAGLSCDEAAQIVTDMARDEEALLELEAA